MKTLSKCRIYKQIMSIIMCCYMKVGASSPLTNKIGRVQDWKGSRLEGCKIGRVKGEGLEECKIDKVEDLRSVGLEECKIGSV